MPPLPHIAVGEIKYLGEGFSVRPLRYANAQVQLKITQISGVVPFTQVASDPLDDLVSLAGVRQDDEELVTAIRNHRIRSGG